MNMMSQERLPSDLARWTIGPWHEALPGPIRLRLNLDGEIIVSGEVESGYLHRGLEKAFELHPWISAPMYADRLDPENPAFGELAFCLAAEEIGGIEVPERAQVIRIILSELNRVSSHMAYIARVARAVGAETMVHYVLRDRERFLDLFELLTGMRFSLNYLRIGGVDQDVTEGFIERVLEACELIRIRLKEYNDLFSFNQAFLKRAVGIGIIREDHLRRFGLSGPNARAAGMRFDIRKSHSYSGYEKLDFTVPTADASGDYPGDAHNRFVQRLREISQSLDLLKQAAETVPAGEFRAMKMNREYRLPRGEAYARVESSRGLLGCYVVSDGSDRPSRVQFRPASLSSLEALPELLVGARLEDLPLICASLDIGIAEVDR